MSVSPHSQNRYIDRPAPSSLADVIEVILDKGLVIDAYVRVSLLGIELVTVDARIVVASVDTYLRFAEAVNRLDLQETQVSGIPELLGGGVSQAGAKGKTAGVIEGIKEKVAEMLPGDNDQDDGARTARESSRSAGRRTATRARSTAQPHTSTQQR